MPSAASRRSRLAHLLIDLKLCPDGVRVTSRRWWSASAWPILVATIRQPIRDWGRIAKRLMDLGVSASLLLLLALPMAVLALAIRLESPGPALFRSDAWASTRASSTC